MGNRIILNGTSYFGRGARENVITELRNRNFTKALVVTDKNLLDAHVTNLVTDVLDKNDFSYQIYSDIKPNPTTLNVQEGVTFCRNSKADVIIAVGGGSAIDTAKGIKYYSKLDFDILAVPTTAGTGAEVTRFSVLYRNKDKESVSDYSIIPNFQIFDYTTLKSLPYEQKVVTSLDAFCHSVEAFWSVDATNESRKYSKKALSLFNDNFARYIENDDSTFEPMLECSMLAGKAINLARTTAPHAFSYKLHKLKGFHHGRAVAVSLAYIWKFMEESNKLNELMKETREITGFDADGFINFLSKLGLFDDLTMTKAQFDETIHGVNIQRLQNFPLKLTEEDIKNIYCSFIDVK